MNSTFSWTGDLGTEAAFWLFHGSLLDLMGQWVRDADLDIGIEEAEQLDPPNAAVQPPFEFISIDGAVQPPDEYMPIEDALASEQQHQDTAFVFHAPEHDHFNESQGPEMDRPEISYDMDLRNSIYISGVLHVVHNIAKALDNMY